MLSEDGPWTDDTVTYAYNSSRVRSNLSLIQPNASARMNGYSYDASGRLKTLASQAGAFTYDFKVGQASSLPLRLSLPGGSYITNAYDTDMRLTDTWLKSSVGTTLNSHAYVVNSANQRTKQTFKDGNYVDYTYDNMGQLMSAKGKESGGSSRSHEQLSYVYDRAGNLNYRTNNALVHTFNVNSTNQLTTITRSGTLTVAGTTGAGATNVTVNSQTATRYSDSSFAKDGLSLSDGDNTFTAIAQDSLGRTDTNAVTVYLPATASFAYDSNGNLTSDGKRGLEYDDENQLIRVTVTNSWKSEFTYDGKMRRRIRKEYAWQSSAWVLTNEVRYVYDGMLSIQERDGNNVPTVTYTRGVDVSGTLESAGGIGGLLARTDNARLVAGLAAAHICYHGDGNGNVTALVSDKQAVVGRYEYDPYGNILSSSGLLTDANAYRFSSKEHHQNSTLICYGYRFYDPNLQRWPNRDPIGDLGFRRLAKASKRGVADELNLYEFVRNSPLNGFDALGLQPMSVYIACRCSAGPIDGSRAQAAQQAGMQAADDAFGVGERDSVGHRALRHCVASAVLAGTTSCEKAECMGTAREDWQNSHAGQTTREGDRGKNNNRVGRQCAGCTGPNAESGWNHPGRGATRVKLNKDLGSLVDCCLEALVYGRTDTGD